MLPKHHLLSQVPLRADSVMRRIQAEIWMDQAPVEVFATRSGPALIGWEAARRMPLKRLRPRVPWGRLFDQRWCKVVFPRKTGTADWFAWRDEGEATLHVDGSPFFGFDVAHRYCLLPRGISEVWVEAHCVQSAIWHPEGRGLSAQGSLFEGAFLLRRNDDAWHAWHDLKCLLDVALALRQQEDPRLAPEVAPGHTQASVQSHSPVYKRLLRWLDDACDALETAGAKAGRRVMSRAFAELRNLRPLLHATLTGHAHIDLVWLWPERIGEQKAVHTFATVNRLMEQYPELRFAYSQPASYEAVQRRAPGLYDEVRKRIRSGRWQATGAMYVESDTLIACGEALMRSFLVGQQEFEKIAGRRAGLVWLPDVFGYSACLPQMIRLAGAKYFFTTKLTWSLVNRFPYSSFVWRGNDGSEVLAHVTQECGYNATLEAAELKNSSWGYQQADIHDEYLLPTGYGDGGGGPTAEMCERARRLDGMPGMPGVRWDQPEAFFDRLAAYRESLPVHAGECYLEGHRGTYTTHGGVKEAFRDLERALQVSEAVSSAMGLAADRTAVWKRLIFAQFHDYIPGSSVWDVYAEGVAELQRLAREQRSEVKACLSRKGGRECFFNPHAVEVSRWITRPGGPVRVQLPPLSGLSVAEAAVESTDRITIGENSFGNAACRVSFDEQGWLRGLRWDGEDAILTGPACRLAIYTDKPARFEAWDLDRHVLSLGAICDAPAVIERFGEGAYRGGIRVRRPIGRKSSATIEYALEAESSLLRLTVDLEWREEYALLKLLVPTGYVSSRARFGIPYGSVQRPQVPSGTHAEAMWEVPFSRWLAVSDERESDGLFAVTEARYGASVRDGVIGLSLVRSPKVVGYDGMRIAWPPALSRVKPPAKHTDIGHHKIRLAFGRYHGGLSRRAHPASLADTLFTEPVAYRGLTVSSPLEGIEGGESLIPAWVQPLDEDRWLLRLHEAGGVRGEARISPGKGWKAVLSDACGRGNGRFSSRLRVPFTPHQIISVVFTRGA